MLHLHHHHHHVVTYLKTVCVCQIFSLLVLQTHSRVVWRTIKLPAVGIFSPSFEKPFSTDRFYQNCTYCRFSFFSFRFGICSSDFPPDCFCSFLSLFPVLHQISCELKYIHNKIFTLNILLSGVTYYCLPGKVGALLMC